MADVEQEFLCSLCQSNKSAQTKVGVGKLAPSMFIGFEPEANYVWDYYDRHGKYPTVRILRRQFPRFRVALTREPLSYYADRLIERNSFTKLQQIMSNVQKHLKSQSIGGVQDAIREMTKASELTALGYSSDLAWEDFDAVQNYQDRTSLTSLFTTPWASLNKIIIGMRSKNLVSIVARPAIGKTWVLILVMIHMWKQGWNVLFISKEMSKEEIFERMDALWFCLDWVAFLEGRLALDELKKMAKARKDAITKSNATVTVTDTEEMEENGIEGVRDKIIEHDPDVVMIDGAYLLTEAGKGSETEKATRISRATKRLAKNRDVLVMQTLQMNRSAEDAEDGGDLQNISWSDAIGQDCLPADTLLDTVDGLCYIVDLEDEEFFIN